jgi:hypothetical protein
MEKEFIPFELAVKLKALGFDEPCQLGWYLPHSEIAIKAGVEPNYWQLIPTHPLLNQIAAPLYQQAFRWFREKYNYHHYIEPIHRDGKVQYEYCVVDSSDDAKEFNEDDIISTYEEAELECLKKLIEIVESKII